MLSLTCMYAFMCCADMKNMQIHVYFSLEIYKFCFQYRFISSAYNRVELFSMQYQEDCEESPEYMNIWHYKSNDGTIYICRHIYQKVMTFHVARGTKNNLARILEQSWAISNRSWAHFIDLIAIICLQKSHVHLSIRVPVFNPLFQSYPYFTHSVKLEI